MRVGGKLTSMISGAKPVYFKTVLPNDKREGEKFVVEEFSKSQKINGYTLTDIKINPDDSHGKPDITAKLNGINIGLQLTELKIGHRPASSSQSERIVSKLIDLILDEVEPVSPLFVDISSTKDYQNERIALKDKQIQDLANTIITGIKNREFSPSIAEFFQPDRTNLKLKYLKIPHILQKTISEITIEKIPDVYSTHCRGKNNIFINFNFDIVVTSDIILEELVTKIYEKKNRSTAEILLIWSYDEDFLGQEEIIKQLFLQKSKNSPFKYIYIFFFINAKELFEVNKKIFIIKDNK